MVKRSARNVQNHLTKTHVHLEQQTSTRLLKRKSPQQARKGFTLVELLIVVIILGILSSVYFPPS